MDIETVYLISTMTIILIAIFIPIFCTLFCRRKKPPNEARDRQGNIFTISDENSTQRDANRYPDFFYLEPSSEEARRIRAQIEKDDKDLPSYEEVMRISALEAAASATSNDNTPSTPAITATVSEGSSPPNAALFNGSNVILTDTTPAPPYSEAVAHSSSENSLPVPSTSRAAAVTLQIVPENSNV